jgi:hypothetical protein
MSVDTKHIESDKAFAFTIFLLNLLVLLVIGGSIWVVYSAATENDRFVKSFRDHSMSYR